MADNAQPLSQIQLDNDDGLFAEKFNEVNNMSQGRIDLFGQQPQVVAPSVETAPQFKS